MMNWIRRSIVVAVTCVGLSALAAAPASADETLYVTGGVTPAAGAVLASSGLRSVPAVAAASSAPAASGAVSAVSGGVLAASGQVLPLQVSSGAVTGVAQAPVQRLAFTGADIAGMVVLGLFAIAIGGVLVRRARPHSIRQL